MFASTWHVAKQVSEYVLYNYGSVVKMGFSVHNMQDFRDVGLVS
jgi:hypothetical protein